jgi:hypothetical protein
MADRVMTTRRRRPEQALQRSVIEYLVWRAKSDVFAFHVPNGGWRSPVEAAILESIGAVAGVPDVIVIYSGRTYALELKAEGGRVTGIQHVVHERLRAAVAIVAAAYGIDEAIAQLRAWGLLR